MQEVEARLLGTWLSALWPWNWWAQGCGLFPRQASSGTKYHIILVLFGNISSGNKSILP